MVSAIRQTVTIRSAGRVEVLSPELLAGAKAEVIVLIDMGDARPAGSPLEALDALQASLGLTATAAADWTKQTSIERQAFGHRT
jgi:hypothetical protein